MQLFGAHLAHVSEEQNENQFDSLLGHHEETLYEQAFHDLWTDAFEEAEEAFVLDDEAHDLAEGLKRLTISRWGWLGLETDFSDDERLCCDCGERLGHGAEDCVMLERWIFGQIVEQRELRTKGLPGLQRGPARVEDVPQTLIGSVGDGGVHDKYQARLHAPPQAGPAILTVNDLLSGREQTLPFVLADRLLPRRHNGDGDGEELGDGAGGCTQGELGGGAGGCVQGAVLQVQAAHDGIPVEIGKIGGADANERASHARVEARDTLCVDDLGDGVEGRRVVLVIGRIRSGRRGDALHLDLETRLDAAKCQGEGLWAFSSRLRAHSHV